MVFAKLADFGRVANEGRAEPVADERLVLDTTTAFFHRLYLLGALALLEAVVLEARLDGARFELAEMTPTERHQFTDYGTHPSLRQR